jgi:cellulose synthase/poly-beta-1,6-N-acetylglucosamine synthase-like glycosyltransferase
MFDRDILCCITACNESEEELALLLSSFKKASIQPYLSKRLEIFIILDKQRDNAPDTLTLIALKKLLNIDSHDYYQDFGCRIIRGIYEDIPYYLYIKGDTLVSGKRYSILLFADIVNNFYRSTPPASTAIVFMDADTKTSGKSIYYLLNELEKNPRCGGATGFLTVENDQPRNIIVLIQEFYLYFLGNTIHKAADSLFNKCIVLPGAFSIVKYSAFMECLDEFSKIPRDNDINSINKLELGEDRYLTTLMIRKGYCTKYVHKAIAKTTVPNTLASLITQQRRWSQSIWSNMIELLFGKKLNKFSIIQYYVLLIHFTNSLTTLWSFSLLATQIWYQSSNNSWIAAICLWFYALILSISFMNKTAQNIGFWLKINVSFFVVLYNYNLFVNIAKIIKIHPLITLATVVALAILYLIIEKYFSSKYIKTSRLFSGLILYFVLGIPIFTVIYLYAIANLDNKNWGTRGIEASKETIEIAHHLEQRAYVKNSHHWILHNSKNNSLTGFQKKIIIMTVLFLINLLLLKLVLVSNILVILSIFAILNLSNQILTLIMATVYHWKNRCRVSK